MTDLHHIVADDKVIPHLANILATVNNTPNAADIIHLSNLVKQTYPKIQSKKQFKHKQIPTPSLVSQKQPSDKDYIIHKASLHNNKLSQAGYGITKEQTILIDNHLISVADHNKVKQIRFWGKVLGTQQDYYILQATPNTTTTLEQVVPGAEKRGEGVNYYTFWVTNNLLQPQWTELPQITPAHLKAARKIKKYFTGNLQQPINSFPLFEGLQKHYLKAQLVRMTNSLEIVPKGVYKLNDQNPKIVQFEDEPKIPEFSELSTLQNWVHRNQNILHLGRCSHYIDPNLPEDQIESYTAELAQKDPQIERLRSITEDKLPQGSPLGVQNIWQIRLTGNTQVFQKDEATLVYATVLLKNIYWPGWVTIGYKNGYTNHYVGYGLKLAQPSWSHYQNNNLHEQPEDHSEYHEPNPKEQPKPVSEAVVAEQAVQE